MTYGTYSAGQALAGRVQGRFARDLDAARQHGAANLAPLPSIESIDAVIDAAFWTSLRREEGYVPKISLALLPREATSHALIFERPLPLNPSALARVAPAVERAGIHLGVWPDGDGICGLGHHPRRCRSTVSSSRWPRPACSSSNSNAAAIDQVREHRRPRRRTGEVRRRERVEPAGLPVAPDLAPRLRRAGVLERFGQRAGAAGGLDARARPWRAPAGRALGAPTPGATRSSHRFSTSRRHPFRAVRVDAAEHHDAPASTGGRSA